MIRNQPKIKGQKTVFGKMFDGISVLVYLAFLFYLLNNWSSLPAEIPTHFDGAGNPDDWSGKGMIWLLPTIGLVLWVGLTFLERYPHVYNYLVPITHENAERQYKNAGLMINVMKNSILLFYTFIIYQSIQVANGAADGLGEGFMFLFLGVIFGSIIFFLLRSWRLK